MDNIIVKTFEESQVEIILENGEPLFELYSTGMALGQVVTAKGNIYPNKERINKNIENADIKPVLRNAKRYLTESQLYDLMLEMKTDKVKPFRKWLTQEVLPTIRKTGGYVVEDREEEFINIYFPSFSDDVKLAMVQDLRSQNKKLKQDLRILNNENDLLSEKALHWADRSFINASVRRFSGGACEGNFSYAWREFKKELLYKHGINLSSRVTKYLNSSGKRTKPKTLDMLDDSEIPYAVSTIVAMCRDKDVDISDLINKIEEENEIQKVS